MLVRFCLAVCLMGVVVSTSLYDLVINGVTCGCHRQSDLNVSKVQAYVYNFESDCNTSYPLSEAADRIMQSDDFHPDQCIHVFVPGFENNIGSEASNEALCALSNYECNSMNILLVIVDHSEYLSGSYLEKLDILRLYEKAVKFTTSVSYSLGKFFSSILKNIPKENFYASGHSLGAHIVGKAAEFSAGFGQTLAKILAIDPASPCYKDCLSAHVKSGQADSVVSIHCNAGELGTYFNLSDYDVYSGDGVTQKGCEGGEFVDLIVKSQASNCSHYKCVPIALQTALKSDIWQATKCNSYEDMCQGSCDNNEHSIVAYDVDPTGSAGVYFIDPTEDLQCEISIY